MWILAEISIVACDIPEGITNLQLFFSYQLNYSKLIIFYVTVIGTAFALNMLFHIPVWCGVLLTGFSTLGLLALQQYGVLN